MIRRNFVAGNNNAEPMTFGQRMGMSPAEAQRQPDAEVWLNVGILTNDEKYPIVTLPYGIPIDTQRPLELGRGSNPEFTRFLKSRNGLLKELQDAAAQLAPGEDAIIGGTEEGLVLQLRRRAAEAVEEPTDVGDDLLGGFTINVRKEAA